MNCTTTATTALELHRGSAVEVLAGLPADHVDLVATDPPYGLTKRFDLAALLADWISGADHDTGGRGLMGHRWDGVVPGPATWAQVLRVLKPGGYAFVFAAPRTVDLMGLALRLAGFEIVDQIVWIHGCLTDDAEILTESGWKKGVDVEVGEVVAQWDSDTGAITLAPVEEVIRAPYRGPMTVFRNHDTDQVLTPNHRVYHRSRVRKQVKGNRTASWSGYQVKEAGEINRWQPLRLPLGGIHDGPGIGGDDYAALLGWVWTEGGFDKTGSGVRLYQSPKANPDEVDKIDRLLGRLGIDAKRYYRERSYHHKVSDEKKDEVCWFFTGHYAESVRRDLPGKHPTFDLLWRMTASEKQAMWDAAMAGDGSGAQFHQKGADDLEWAQTLLSTIGQRGRIGMRKDRPGIGWVSVTPRPETEIVRRHLAAAPDEHYEGDVWCVKVPTGAFVARRNGKVFITGNSGWPKSRDVGKQMAKKFGDDDPRSADWDGWGTSLKPAQEPVIWARKPLNLVPLAVEWQSIQHSIGALLWRLLSPAKRAGLASTSSHLGRDGQPPCASALALAALASSPDESERTAMCSSPEEESTLWSIASSWSDILDVLSTPTSTSTTSTATNLTIASRTLSSLLEPVTSPTTIRACGCPVDGPWSGAPSATSGSNGGSGRSRHIPKPSADASATWPIVAAAEAALAAIAESCSSVAEEAPFARGAATTRVDGRTEPANEPIIVARKPMAGTVVDNVLTFGTGALHIDAGRIGDTGRFPANVVLAHEPGCRPLGEVAVRTGSGTAPTRGISGADQDGNTSATFGAETRPAGTVEVTHRNPDGTETVDAWDCAPGCAVAALDSQSGRLKARGNVNPTRSGGGNGRSPASAKAVIADHGAGDWGGASRFFARFTASTEEIEQWSQGRARDAEESSSPSDLAEGSAGSPAQADTTPTDLPNGRGSTGPSTNDTLTGSRKQHAPDTRPTPSSASGHSHGQQPDGPSRTRSRALDAASPTPTGTTTTTTSPSTSGGSAGPATSTNTSTTTGPGVRDFESADRFIYCAKPSQSERNAGLADDQTNEHPSVKPVALMRYLIELAARPGAVVLDPYLGSGTTAVAAAEAGVACVGIDRDDDGLYLPVAAARARHAGAVVETYGWELEAIAS